MSGLNPANERIKRRYLRYLDEARGLAPASIDHAARAIATYDEFSGRRDFKHFSSTVATNFKRYLRSRRGRPSASSSRATVVTTARQVQQFFHWLAEQPGHRSIRHSDVDFFNVTRRDARLFTDRAPKVAPGIEQVQLVIRSMPADTDVELRDRAILACALLTGARVAALISLKLKHVRRDRLGIDQDAREVRVKHTKTQETTFFRVGDDIEQMFLDYVDHLRSKLHRGPDDPLFPRSQPTVGKGLAPRAESLTRLHWQTTDPIRRVFRDAFARAGLPYFTPHTVRNALASAAQLLCRSPEDFKIFSQNLGHDDTLTTAISYARVPLAKQVQRIRELRLDAEEPSQGSSQAGNIEEMLRALCRAQGVPVPAHQSSESAFSPPSESQEEGHHADDQ